MKKPSQSRIISYQFFHCFHSNTKLLWLLGRHKKFKQVCDPQKNICIQSCLYVAQVQLWLRICQMHISNMMIHFLQLKQSIPSAVWESAEFCLFCHSDKRTLYKYEWNAVKNPNTHKKVSASLAITYCDPWTKSSRNVPISSANGLVNNVQVTLSTKNGTIVAMLKDIFSKSC